MDERSTDGQSLIWHFHQIISLASLAYIFTTIHAIQYSIRDHEVDDIDSTSPNPQDMTDSTESHHSASSATHNLPQTATASNTKSSERTSGRWTNDEMALLLKFVRDNCVLTTTRGLN